MNLAMFLKDSRECRGLSLRQLAMSIKLDHAYIYRLENGEKNNPSEAAIKKLITGLRLTERESNILNLLAKQDVDDSLYAVMQDNFDLSWETLKCTTTIVGNRGKWESLGGRRRRPETSKEWVRFIKILETLLA